MQKGLKVQKRRNLRVNAKDVASATVDSIKDAQDLSDYETTLRAFDLEMKYGPCTGLSRIERYVLV